LQLAKGLESRHYEVHFACDARYRSMLASLVGQFHTIHTQDSHDFLAALAQGRPPYSSATLCADAEEDLNLLDEVQPDLVVADFRLSMRIATTLRHIPYATITNTHWSLYFRSRENESNGFGTEASPFYRPHRVGAAYSFTLLVERAPG